jgi:hypothetical protein
MEKNNSNDDKSEYSMASRKTNWDFPQCIMLVMLVKLSKVIFSSIT